MLTVREMTVLSLLYGFDLVKVRGIGDIAEAMHLSRRRVGQIRDRALQKLGIAGLSVHNAGTLTEILRPYIPREWKSDPQVKVILGI